MQLGRRNWGDISQGSVNLMPFIYKLHMTLALGAWGTLALGIVALIWTIDCLVGFRLTLPLVITDFLATLATRLVIKHWAGFFRLNFDLHRAGGLWLWPMLLVFAWSSVLFNLRPVYEWAMHSALSYKPPPAVPSAAPGHLIETPRLDWQAAEAAAEKLMVEQAIRRDFTIVRATGLSYMIEGGTYTYFVQSSRDLGDSTASTSLTFDGDTGKFVSLKRPDRQRGGDLVDAWLPALHRAEVFGLPYRIFVCLMGVTVVMLSVTGIYIWWRKRSARKFSATRRRLSRGPGRSRIGFGRAINDRVRRAARRTDTSPLD